MKIVSAWQTGNTDASKKVKTDSRSAIVQADAMEKMVIRQRMSFVHTAKESSLMMCKERYGCNPSYAKTGAMKNVQGRTRTNICVITACRTNRVQYLK
jgi:hypothetical protein